MSIKHPQVAIVYDKVNTPYGGAEKVLSAIHDIFPQAPLLTSVHHPATSQWAKHIKIIPSFLQQLHLSKWHALLTPLFPLAFETLDVSQYDVIISVTSGQAKGVLTKPHQLHICYMLTPTRYLFSHKYQYQHTHSWINLPIIRSIFQSVRAYLTAWDYAASYRPDYLIPISQRVGKRIERYYHRHCATTLYPTVTPHPLRAKKVSWQQQLPAKYALVVSRLVAYKRIDSAIKACLAESLPLIIVGSGHDLSRLQKIAGKHGYTRKPGHSITQTLTQAHSHQASIIFMHNCSDQDVDQFHLYAWVYLMIGEEDFGITALEAYLYGTPVIIHQKSGVSEILTTSIKITDETVANVVAALKQVVRKPIGRSQHTAFSTKDFASNFKKVVYDLWHHHQHALRKEQYVIPRS